MDAEQRADAGMGTGPSSEFASHEMRITQSGKIRAWVEFALKFFEACIPGQFITFQTNNRCRLLRIMRRERWYCTLSP
jgi:hypothetical protein